uniref:Uncharacterized protein n=1 Tax=Panagrolaimus superbus TaxID=310955 RepID=A0A914YZ16_9BILA
MKLTVAVFLCLVAVTVATHQGGRDNGGYNGRDNGRDNGRGRGPYGGGNGADSSSSSSSESEEEPTRPKQCALVCTSSAKFNVFVDRTKKEQSCNDGRNAAQNCAVCCQAWGLSKGVSTDMVIGQAPDGRTCVCCESKCR